MNNFERDGYIILKNAMSKKECQKLIKQTIIPILHKKNIYLTKSDSWKNKIGQKQEGKLIYGKNGGHIISKTNKHFRFKSFFESTKLNHFLNKIHSRNLNTKKWNFKHLASEGLGWIHLRYPFYNYNMENNNHLQCSEDSFHLDGTTYTDTIDPTQSVILLPFITTVNKNGGGTAVIPGSHKLINDYLLRYNYKTNDDINIVINKIVEHKYNKIIDITGNQGDILIMHQHLLHSPSLADINSNVRITFNLSTEI